MVKYISFVKNIIKMEKQDKRKGNSGRKPVLDHKIPITFYVRKSIIENYSIGIINARRDAELVFLEHLLKYYSGMVTELRKQKDKSIDGENEMRKVLRIKNELEYELALYTREFKKCPICYSTCIRVYDNKIVCDNCDCDTKI